MTIAEILVKQALELAAKLIKSKFLKSEAKSSRVDIAPRNLAAHLTYVANWSARIPFLGLGTAKNTDTESIQLVYHDTVRKFRGRTSETSTQTEAALLTSASHHLLVGDPGAGKSTSLKRIARVLLQASPPSSRHEPSFPILLRLKELKTYTTIFDLLAEVLGFPIGVKHRVIVEEKEVQYRDDDGKIRSKLEKIERKEPYAAIGDSELRAFILRFLDESGALLLIDGLDEIKEELLAPLVRDLRKLALELSRAKMIVTSRTGFYYSVGSIEGFDILDILPLDAEQIFALASIWTESPSLFIRALASSPYRDLADRPLLLSQLLLIFDRYGTLPKSPREIYQLVVELLLKEWDADRQIVRLSQYSGFSPKRKSEFLAELAFHLMYTTGTTQFGSADLKEIYERICNKFELPKDEGDAVAAEIETHTGIVISVGHRRYEFSHLSIQEYLCADYIVRSPLTHETVAIVRKRPEPVAVAIALASDASSWFCNLVLDQDVFAALKLNLGPFISRLVIERPVFRVDELIGFCVFYVYADISPSANPDLLRLFKNEFSGLVGIRESVEQLLQRPSVISIEVVGHRGGKEIQFAYDMPKHNISHASYRKVVRVPPSVLARFGSDFGIQVDKLT